MPTETISLGLAFLAGLLTFLSPCVFPIIPSYISYITGVSLERLQEGQGIRRATALHSLCFILGFSAVFIALGASATLLGKFLTQYQGLLAKMGGGVIILFGLHLAGWLPIRFLLKEKRLAIPQRKMGYFGSFIIGAVFSMGWTPCVGPVLASVLVYASTLQTTAKGIVLLSFYSLGLGIPFFFSSIAVNSLLTSSKWLKRHLQLFEKIAGLLLVVFGMMLITNSFGWLSAALSRWLLPLSEKLNI